MILETRKVAKPWGVDALPVPFEGQGGGERIGEIWFEPLPAADQLLVKYIFTSQALSVQVHPSDAQTLADGLDRQGKEECWLILEAEPGAKLGIGFTQEISADAMRDAAKDGSIEHLLAWHSVAAGDFVYIPANTVHAIGAGVSLIEVQQNSDITYRLYDYGRPRELHLDKAVAIAAGKLHDRHLRRRVPENGHEVLVDGPLFRLDRLDGKIGDNVYARYAGPLLVIPQVGLAHVAGEMVAAGQCALADSLGLVAIEDGSKVLIAQSA
ncbi:class I mannose-6-phosphate isomerase [Qipengyuania sp. DY56-A-20]|uniref:Class I mannose-6-phosphate isomerase n=1 Tax=Qipengyuania benthica TaxID=3067651 RepID=A0ABT9H3Y4_9SPHN|nr:class I mannose-6-phosphate isomerase [Qipengyuania sp. DY56-A-20]MDP4538016.1 class I mannose-6-phosphate isomerase [Qipengyuania sp. DY56-A-20]